MRLVDLVLDVPLVLLYCFVTVNVSDLWACTKLPVLQYPLGIVQCMCSLDTGRGRGVLSWKGKQTCSWLHPIIPRGHRHIWEGHPQLRLRGSTKEKDVFLLRCFFFSVCVSASVCKSSLVHSAGNSCRQDFLFCTGNKMAENGRPGTMLWKSATTQVRRASCLWITGQKGEQSTSHCCCRNHMWE